MTVNPQKWSKIILLATILGEVRIVYFEHG